VDDTLDALDMGAIFSPDREYRYVLWRRWNTALRTCTFIGLTPSTADETGDDPTIRRCIRFARDWGFGAMRMLNLFAYRATDPMVMRQAEDPIGPMNDRYIVETAQMSGLVVAAWGMHGRYLDRGKAVRDFFPVLSDVGGSLARRKPLYCLGTTSSGEPRHPLYLKASLRPEVFKG
jgi:hypothetical protein